MLLQTKIIAAMALALSVTGWFLYKQIEWRGADKQVIEQLKQAVKESNDEVVALVEQQMKDQEIAEQNIKRRNKLIVNLRGKINQLSDIEEDNQNVQDVLDTALPDELVNWLQDGSRETGAGEAVPTEAIPTPNT